MATRILAEQIGEPMHRTRTKLAETKIKPNGKPTSSPARLYTSQIIKAGALIADSKTLLSHWNSDDSVEVNLVRLQSDNVFGKASRSRVEDILRIFRSRYLIDDSVTRALVSLVRGQSKAAVVERVLYYHSAISDPLLYDFIVEHIAPKAQSGNFDISVHECQRTLFNWSEKGKTKAKWSESTAMRIAQGLLSTLRDFGILTGVVRKKIAPVFLPVEAFAYIAFHLKQRQPSGLKMIDHADWKLFFLNRDTVERFMFEAHQRELLEYHVAGSVTRLTFPAKSLEEYADVLAQR